MQKLLRSMLVAALSVAALAACSDDDEPTASVSQAAVRVVHASPNAPNVDVLVDVDVTAPGADINTATPPLTNVAFRGFSSYLSVPAGQYRVRVVGTGTKTPVAIDATLTFAAGQVRTTVARDNVGGGAPLNAIVLNDLN